MAAGTPTPGYREVSPAPPLSTFVRRVWSLALPAASAPERIVPDGCCEIVLTLDGHVVGGAPGNPLHRRPDAILVGQMSRVTMVQPLGPARLIGIRLHPWAAAEFLELAAGDLRDRIVDLRLASGRLHALFSPLVDHGPQPVPAVARVLTALEEYVAHRPRPRAVARGAVEMIRSNPRVVVSDVARRLGWSERRLQRVFTTEVGIPPKTFARITRVQHAIHCAESHPERTWASVAAGCGYVDQSHLVRDFGELAGCTPMALRGEPQPMRDRLLLRD